MATVTQLYRYPVKSFGGETIESVELSKQGIPGDRSWSLQDATGTLGAKKFPQLMSAHARLTASATTARPSPPIEVTLPNQQTVLSTDTNASELLSGFTDHAVTLSPLPQAGDDTTRSSHYFDAFPLLILSTQALVHLAAIAQQQNFDVRRFRPNILVDAAQAGFAENEWVGQDCRIGAAVVRIETACPRCIMTTHAVEELPKDPDIMRTLVEHNDGNLGVYASIVEPGRIVCGDTLEIR